MSSSSRTRSAGRRAPTICSFFIAWLSSLGLAGPSQDLGDDGRGVTVLTCHGFAMRLVGASFAGRAEPLDDDAFGT